MRIAVGTIIASKYKLEAPLARGGMGAVWIARHAQLGSQLALKFLDPRLAVSPSFVARFEREARAAAAIQSPHVVQVQDLGVEGGVPYIVMELLRGEDLRSRLRRVGRLSMAETAGMLVQVGKALRRAHEAGIVHRDIKPGNLFLAQMDGDEVLKVLDFGIAKQPDLPIGDATQTGEIVGSPHYVSPEQARGEKDVDHRSDVWSVGVITFRMITGQLPFPGEGMGAVLSKLLTQPPPPVRSIVPELPAALDSFFARALAKDREERFQTVRALVDAYMSLLRNEALEDSISPPSWSSIHNLSRPPEGPGSLGDVAIPRPAPLPSLVTVATGAASVTAPPTPATVIHPLSDLPAEREAPLPARPRGAPGGLPPGVTSTTGAMAAAAAMTSEAAMTGPASRRGAAGRAAMPSAATVVDGRRPSCPPSSGFDHPPSSGFDTLTPSAIPKLRPHHPARRAGLFVAVGAAIVGAGGAYLFATRPVVMPVEPGAAGLASMSAPVPQPAPSAAPAPRPTLAPSAAPTSPLGPPRSAVPAGSSARPPLRLPGSAAPVQVPPPPPSAPSPPVSAWPFPSPGSTGLVPTAAPSAISPLPQPSASASARPRWGM